MPAQELLLTAGGGSQKKSEQSHKSVGLDYGFLRWVRSDRQHLQVGASYTYIESDGDEFDELWALSVYPQLSLYPAHDGSLRSKLPDWAESYFFVRALGPMNLTRLTSKRNFLLGSGGLRTEMLAWPGTGDS